MLGDEFVLLKAKGGLAGKFGQYKNVGLAGNIVFSLVDRNPETRVLRVTTNSDAPAFLSNVWPTSFPDAF